MENFEEFGMKNSLTLPFLTNIISNSLGDEKDDISTLLTMKTCVILYEGA